MDKIKVGISSCLLGNKVRYDGGHQQDRYITDTLGQCFDWLPVCPEVEYGLGAPREAMRLEGDPESPRLVTIHTNVDHTEGMRAWARKRLRDLEQEGLRGFIFKSRSPSSGMRGVTVHASPGMPGGESPGIFADAFMKYFPHVPVIDDSLLHDPHLRENFIERIFTLSRSPRPGCLSPLFP